MIDVTRPVDRGPRYSDVELLESYKTKPKLREVSIQTPSDSVKVSPKVEHNIQRKPNIKNREQDLLPRHGLVPIEANLQRNEKH